MRHSTLLSVICASFAVLPGCYCANPCDGSDSDCNWEDFEYQTCFDNTDCSANMHCAWLGSCVTGAPPLRCATTNDCAPSEACERAACVPKRCLTDVDCGLDGRCIAGACRMSCELDNECPSGQRCADGACTRASEPRGTEPRA